LSIGIEGRSNGAKKRRNSQGTQGMNRNKEDKWSPFPSNEAEEVEVREMEEETH